MATRDAIVRRQVIADERVHDALVALTTHVGIDDPMTVPLPASVAPEFRAMAEREAMAATLEAVVAALPSLGTSDADPGEAADQPEATARKPKGRAT